MLLNQSFLAGASNNIWLYLFCPSVLVFGMLFLPWSYHRIFMKLVADIHLIERLQHWRFLVKGSDHTYRSKYLSCPVHESLSILTDLSFIGLTNTIRKWCVRLRNYCQVKRFKAKVTQIVGIFLQYLLHGPVCSVTLCLVDRFFGKFCSIRSLDPNLFHQFTSYVAQITPMAGIWVAHHLYVKRSKAKIAVRSCQVPSSVFCLSI